MQLIVDVKEQLPLEFVRTEGVEIVKENLHVGDYTARHKDGQLDTTVIERKSIADLFSSYTSNYDAERAKFIRAKTRNLKFILAIEASALKVREGHFYTKDDTVHQVGKDGISQVRQLMTITRKYDVEVWYCQDRTDMAFRIMEYFLTHDRSL